jgi:uncharacterized protein
MHREIQNGMAPPRYKLALVTWIGAYLVITLILGLLGPTLAPRPVPVRTLVISGIMVVTLTWAVVPALSRLFSSWLSGEMS